MPSSYTSERLCPEYNFGRLLKMGFMIRNPQQTQGSSLPAILMGGFVAFGGILFGYDTGTIGGILAMGDLVSNVPLFHCVLTH